MKKDSVKFEIMISIQGQTSECVADGEGNWQVTLMPLHESEEELLAISSGSEHLDLPHIAVGEVWIAGGQSNMEFHMRYEKHLESVRSTCYNPHMDTKHAFAPACAMEKELVRKLKEKMNADPEVICATMEERVYETLGLGICIDLFVRRTTGASLYKVKAGGSKVENLYQLLIYWDGCERDGKPVNEAVLIAARHPKEVRMMAEELRRRADAVGKRYNIRLSTWTEEGITLSRQVA